MMDARVRLPLVEMEPAALAKVLEAYRPFVESVVSSQ
jgi:hypothetical protein